MIVTNRNNNELSSLYEVADESKCDLKATCGTCMYAVLPQNYDAVVEYTCYCARREKEPCM